MHVHAHTNKFFNTAFLKSKSLTDLNLQEIRDNYVQSS